MNQDVIDYFEVMRLATAAMDCGVTAFLKSPFSTDEVIGSNVRFSNRTYRYSQKNRWDVLMRIDGSVMTGVCSLDGCDITASKKPTENAKKNYIKRLIAELQSSSLSETTPFWPVFTFAQDTSIKTLKFGHFAADIRRKIENSDQKIIPRFIVNFKMTGDYINEHPFTIEKLKKALDMKDIEMSMNENPFIIEHRKMLFNSFRVLKDYVIKASAENAIAYPFVILNPLRAAMNHIIYDYRDDTDYINLIARSSLGDEFGRWYFFIFEDTKNKALTLLNHVLKTSEWRDAFEAAKQLQDDESFPDIRYYLPLFLHSIESV